MQGVKKERVWVGFVTMSYMVRSFYDWHLTHGVHNWDVVLAKILRVVMVSSLGARGGDVARSSAYEGEEYLQWRHIKLVLDEDDDGHVAPVFSSLRAEISIHYEKHAKTTLNSVRTQIIRPLKKANVRHVCVVTLILVHALRHGMVEAVTLPEILEKAAETRDKCVKWTYPARPVLCGLAQWPDRCDLDRPAKTANVTESIREMGFRSGSLKCMYSHALRNGAARDVAHLQRTGCETGSNDHAVRAQLGHSIVTHSKGTTDKYIGESSRDWYAERAENSTMSDRMKAPRFAATSSKNKALAPVKKSHIAEAVTRWAAAGETCPASRRGREKKIRRERAKAFEEEAEDILSRKATSTTTCISVPTLPNTSTRSTTIPSTPTPGNEDTSFIDPQLLDEDQIRHAMAEVAEVNCLHESLTGVGTFIPTAEDITGSSMQNGLIEDEESRLLLSDNREDTVYVELDTPEAWIDYFSRINVVCVSNFAESLQRYQRADGSLSWEDGPGKYALARHGSKDEPTAWLFTCTKSAGCGYTTHSKTISAAMKSSVHPKELPLSFKSSRSNRLSRFVHERAVTGLSTAQSHVLMHMSPVTTLRHSFADLDARMASCMTPRPNYMNIEDFITQASGRQAADFLAARRTTYFRRDRSIIATLGLSMASKKLKQLISRHQPSNGQDRGVQSSHVPAKLPL